MITPRNRFVDTDVEAGTLYIHLLHDTDVAANQAHVQRLAELTCRAFPGAAGGPIAGVDIEGDPT